MWPTLQQPWYFFEPGGIAVDRTGNLYLADGRNHQVQKLTATGEFLTKWGKYGSGDGELKNPNSIVVGPDNSVFVAGPFHVTKFSPGGEFLLKWSGSEIGSFDNIYGMAVDLAGDIYVADSHNHRIQKFTSDGEFVDAWGTEGTGDGQFHYPSAVAIDEDSVVYVCDQKNDRIQKFTAEGEFIGKWGTHGFEEGRLWDPESIAVGPDGNVYIGEAANHRIQVFTKGGDFVRVFIDSRSNVPGGFFGTNAIAVGRSGNFFFSDGIKEAVYKFDAHGLFSSKWSSSGSGPGQFRSPAGITIDSDGYIYVADWANNRIQKFSSDGLFMTEWGGNGGNDGEFRNQKGIEAGPDNSIYVADNWNHRIQKFSPAGAFLTKWGSEGRGDGQFINPQYVASDSAGNIYVTDYETTRIQKFDSNGNFLLKWSIPFDRDDLRNDKPIAIDANDRVYVLMFGRIYRCGANGEFVEEWGHYSTLTASDIYLEDDKIYWPNSISIDENNNVYVFDYSRYSHYAEIKVYDEAANLISRFGKPGTYPGMFSPMVHTAADGAGNVFVSDQENHRIQVFSKVPLLDGRIKAIVLAGGGPFPGNNLWTATQKSANFAYRTLIHQGFTKEAIRYLTADTDLDLDTNGVSDDVDGDASCANLQQAITEWAADADSLLLYLVDHGGDGTFRMSGRETLAADTLDAWLDNLQNRISGKVILVYDACRSGSFLASLPPPAGKERILVASTASDETAKFVSQGAISFSSFFWPHIFNGLDVKNAFELATAALGSAVIDQQPQLDGNGNGVGNEADDLAAANGLYIGNGTKIQGDAPAIESICAVPQMITNGNAAVLRAQGVADSDGIARVWAVIRPPDYHQGSSDNPVWELPSVDLLPAEDGAYEIDYEHFSVPGTYQLVVYAKDRIGNTSIPESTTVTVQNPMHRKAILVAGGGSQDPMWPAVKRCVGLAYEALQFQGYPEEDIYFMSPVTFSEGVDALTTLSNLEFAVKTWGGQQCQDLVIYLIGPGDIGLFDLNEAESLFPQDLSVWLDALQASWAGKVALIYDGSFSGSFLSALTPPEGRQRIFVASADTSQISRHLSSGDVSFSKFFWSQVFNGTDLYKAFSEAKNAMWVLSRGAQTALLDDSGNGRANEKIDGAVSRYYHLGSGVMLAGDAPLIGAVSPDRILSGESSAVVWAEDVTTTGTIERVWAVIASPCSSSAGLAAATIDLREFDLMYNDAENRWEAACSGFEAFGEHTVTVFAKDTDGAISMPETTTVTQAIGPDCYEVDDTNASAGVITVNAPQSRKHTFHGDGDSDWVKFYGIGGQHYEIKTENPGTRCDTVLVLYDEALNPLTDPGSTDAIGDKEGCGVGETISWLCPADGIYFLQARQSVETDSGADTDYDMRIDQGIGSGAVLIGKVTDSTGWGISDTVVRSIACDAAAITAADGSYRLILPAGTWTVGFESFEFGTAARKTVVIEAQGLSRMNLAFAAGIKGNIDGDGQTNIADAILSLQVIAGTDTPGAVRKDYADCHADVGGDKEVGIEETIYILQAAVEIR